MASSLARQLSGLLLHEALLNKPAACHLNNSRSTLCASVCSYCPSAAHSTVVASFLSCTAPSSTDPAEKLRCCCIDLSNDMVDNVSRVILPAHTCTARCHTWHSYGTVCGGNEGPDGLCWTMSAGSVCQLICAPHAAIHGTAMGLCARNEGTDGLWVQARS